MPPNAEAAVKILYYLSAFTSRICMKNGMTIRTHCYVGVLKRGTEERDDSRVDMTSTSHQTRRRDKVELRCTRTESYKGSCLFYGGRHFNDEYSEVRSVQVRKGKLKDRCFVCLKTGHRARDWWIKTACWYCGKQGKHNRALCPKLESECNLNQLRPIPQSAFTCVRTEVKSCYKPL